MFINIDIGQGADIYLVFAFLGKCIGGLLIQSVDSFNDQDVILSQLFEIALIFPLSALEVKGRQLHTLTG